MKPFIFTLTLLSSAALLTACDNIKKVLPQTENEKSEQSVKTQAEEKTVQEKTSHLNIETVVEQKIAESIKSLSDNSSKYILNSKKIINADLNHDSKSDYIVEASYCDESDHCPVGSLTKEILVFTTDQNDQINFITKLDLPINTEVTKISKDGIVTIETAEYTENDAACCPSIITSKSYALVGTKLTLLAK